MTTADPASVPSSAGFRELGNEEYRKGNHLKAAALYTRAIKDDPDNAALRSNRSAALLQLHKLSKALADADECIKLRPDWDKGYYRRGAALEALGRLGDALETYQQAARYSPTSKQISDKVSSVQRLLRQQKARAEAGVTADA